MPYGVEFDDSPDQPGDFIEYWHRLRRHKTTIILATFGGLILGLAVGIPMKPVFRAHTTVEVLNINEDFMNMKQANQTTNSSSDSFDTSEEETQAKLLQGDALMKRVIAKFDPAMASKKRARPLATSGWRSWFHLTEYSRPDKRQTLIDKASHSLKIHTTPRTRVLEATIDSIDAGFAAEFANSLVEEFMQQNLETRYQAAHKTSEWLTREIDDARAKLQSSEDALQKYARESRLLFTDETTNVETEKLQQIQKQLSDVNADRISKEARYKLSTGGPPDALADVLGDDGLRETSAKVNDLRRQVASLSAVFNPGYDKLQQAQAELAAMQSAFEHDRNKVLQRIENDYRQALSNENLLSATYDRQVREVTGQSEKGIQYNILKREVDSNRQLYDTMLQQTKQASIASAMRPSNVRIVDAADPPDKPISPNFALNSVVGLFTGLFMSITFVTLRDRADRALKQPGDVKLWVNLRELGTIPNAAYSRKALYGPTDSKTKLDGAIVRENATYGVELMTLKNKSSIVAEAFRSTLTSIFFIGESGNPPKVLVFTSSNPADGKTTVVSNLAIAAAEIRFKMLIIDADLRRPRMHSVFNLSNDRGLGDLLLEEYSDSNLINTIQQTSVSGLDVLTGGSPTSAAVHLLYSPNFEVILNRLKSLYDMILIDTPPMLQMTDARVVGRLADSVVLVARVGRTTRDALVATRARLEEDRIDVLGTVLNDWNPKTATNRYYYSSSGYYSSYSPK